jgi:large subunit ribosomal protein L23
VTNAREIIRAPVISEKSYADAERGKYTFVVKADATKPEIRRAVEEIWGVRVSSVNTMKRHGKKVRRRYVTGRRADSCRAVVTLHAGDKIEMFEGA